jgi:nicotinate-nucleotide--dimethylbenzimidazole phosphoribosyltransferase
MNDWWREPAKPLDFSARDAASARQGRLTKPPGSLGRLEEIAIRLAAMQGREKPALARPWISVFAGDHGVVEEGVTAYPQAVTQQMLLNFIAGGAAVAVAAREAGARLEVVDAGTLAPEPIPGVVWDRAAAGTANLARGPAMTPTQLDHALAAGRRGAERALTHGADIFIGGEMGIGNTTPAAALGCALLGLPGAALAGPGTGLDGAGVARKAAVIDRALVLHGFAPPFEKGGLGGIPQADRIDTVKIPPTHPFAKGGTQSESALAALRCLGGFEIAALAGAYIACAQAGLPALVDGFITTAAALVACRLNPGAREWLLFSHRSAEPGHARLLQALDARPLLELDMRLGEGSGAAVALPLLRLACALHGSMATFAEAGVSEGIR